jgi:hypothetical protein
MPIFRCLVRGENFPFLFDGAWRTQGFYTTRYVEAANEYDAEDVALEALQSEDALQRDPSTPGLEAAQVYFEKIEEVSQAGANAGFTFFDEDKR